MSVRPVVLVFTCANVHIIKRKMSESGWVGGWMPGEQIELERERIMGGWIDSELTRAW